MKTETENFEVKFRAWDGKGMIYRGLHDRNWYTAEKGGKVVFGMHPDDEHQLKVMQFMNFQDKNKVDVYLDDIVMDERGRIMRVGYFNYRYCLIAITETNFHHANFFDWMWEDQVLIEIIGNIHKNPELLNLKKVK